MKAQQLREMSLTELAERIASLEEEMFNLRFQQKIGQLSNPVRMRIVRRDIARMKTIVNEKKRGAAVAAGA